jgi:hypothetical protein
MISAFFSSKNNLSHGLNILLNISIFTGILVFATISHAFGDTGQNQETPGRILVGCEPYYPPYCFIIIHMICITNQKSLNIIFISYALI